MVGSRSATWVAGLRALEVLNGAVGTVQIDEALCVSDCDYDVLPAGELV